MSQIKLILAPMAGFTDKAFRQICQQLGADITWSEMVSSEGIVRHSLDNNKSLFLAEKYSPKEKNYWVQIFGKSASAMSQAASIIEKEIKPFGIDINLGCPVPKAQKAGYGAIQINNIHQVIEIIHSIKDKISLPLSLKTRLGIKQPTEILSWANLLEEAGINQLVVHARTLQGMFIEKPHWETITQLQKNLKIPVVYNGGIKTPQDAYSYHKKTNIPFLMIGQASLGNPWIFQEIKKYFTSNFTSNYTPPYQQPNFKQIIFQHAQLIQKYYSQKENPFLRFRSHLSFYLKGMPHSKHWKQQAVQIKNLQDVENILNQIPV